MQDTFLILRTPANVLLFGVFHMLFPKRIFGNHFREVYLGIVIPIAIISTRSASEICKKGTYFKGSLIRYKTVTNLKHFLFGITRTKTLRTVKVWSWNLREQCMREEIKFLAWQSFFSEYLALNRPFAIGYCFNWSFKKIIMTL